MDRESRTTGPTPPGRGEGQKLARAIAFGYLGRRALVATVADPNPETLEIRVDSAVHVPSGGLPRKVVDAIRRQIRKHVPARRGQAGETRQLLNLLQTRGGVHRLPQGLLPRVTEACQRYGVPYAVLDRRSMVSCPALRSRVRPSDEERAALRRLLLRDSGVIVASEASSRHGLVVEMAARRQQRTLLAAPSDAEAEQWVEALRQGLDLPPEQVCRLEDATADAWVQASTYATVLQLPDSLLRSDFGMVVCAGLDQAPDPLAVMRVIRTAGARYLLGVASAEERADEMHSTLFLALGGVACRLVPHAGGQTPLQPGCRFETTSFAFAAYRGRAQYQALLAAVAGDEERCAQIAADIAREAGAGRATLVVSERRDQLERLDALLPPTVTRGVITSQVRPAERDTVLQRFERGELVVLLAPTQIACKSLRTQRPERLFLAFPFSYVRKLEPLIEALLQPAPGQHDAVIYDYDDPGVETLHRSFAKRRSFLEQLQRRRAREALRQVQMKLPL